MLYGYIIMLYGYVTAKKNRGPDPKTHRRIRESANQFLFVDPEIVQFFGESSDFFGVFLYPVKTGFFSEFLLI